jgi:hypothetical protein
MLLAALPQPVARITTGRSNRSPFSPEFTLLLEICRNPQNVACDAPFSAMDWQEFYRLADHNGLAPLVYEALSRCPGSVPQETLEAFRLRSFANARQTLWFSNELLRIVGRLQQASVEVLPYKGPTLAQMLYDNPSARQYSDLDLLVHPQDVHAAKAILQELGYTPHNPLPAAQERAYLRSGYECVFDAAHGRNLVELQWQIVPRFYAIPFDIDGFFRRAIPVKPEGADVRTLCPADLVLVLCVHAAKHGWTKLSWLFDIAELSKSHVSDWSRVLEDATSLGIRRIIAITFLLIHHLLEREIPEPLKSLTGDPTAQAIAQELLPGIVAGEEYDAVSPAYFRLMLRSRERWRERARFLSRLIFTPSAGEWEAIRLPAILFPLYRLVRIFRLAARTLSTSSAPPGSGPSR